MVRSVLVLGVTGLALLLLGPPTLLLAWVTGSARPLFVVGRGSVGALLAMAGIRVRVHGRERLDPEVTYLFMANHRSNVDPPVVLLALGRDVRMLAKAELFKLPVLGAALRLAGFVPVQRDDRGQAFAAVDRGAEDLRRGVDFVAFPEGTRSRDGSLLPFKKGPFVMAIKGSVPVVPMAIRGTENLMEKGGWRLCPGIAEVEILEPIETRGLGLEDRHELLERTRSRMARALGDEVTSRVRPGRRDRPLPEASPPGTTSASP